MFNCKHSMLRGLCAICLILLLIVLPNNAKSDPMSDMFQRWGMLGTSTSPGVYESQERGFAIGGKLNARVRQETIPPGFSIQLPSVKAGCGGLDIFAGSFSWISSENFTKTMKAIGQNAIGYAFSLGLEVVCANCAAQLNKLQHYMNQITKMSGDSCQATKALFGTAFDAMTDQSIGTCISETAKDEKGDYANAWLTCAGKEEAAMKTTLKSMFPWNNDKVKKQGTPGKSTTREAAALAELSVEDTQWMESLLGTYHTQSQDGVTTRCAYEKPTVKMSELLEGGEIELLICAQAGDVAGQCLKYGRQKTTVVGYKQKVRAQIQAIYEKNKANPATGLEGAEKTFVERTTVPIQHWTRQLATLRNDNVAAGVISEISDIAAVEYAFQTVEYYINILEGGISNGAITSCDKGDPAMTQQIADVRSKRSEEFEKAIKDMQSKNEMNQFLAKIFRGPQQDTAKKLFFSFDLNKKS